MDATEYLERATSCRERAAEAISDDLRANWLKVAEVWLQMANDHERAFQITADALAKASETAR